LTARSVLFALASRVRQSQFNSLAERPPILVFLLFCSGTDKPPLLQHYSLNFSVH